MKKRTFWVVLAPLALLLGLITAHGCWKIDDPTPDTPLTEEDKLPPATQEGKNTFGCLVNGKAFKPKRGGILQPGIECSFSELADRLSLTAYHYGTDYWEMVSIGEDSIKLGVLTSSENSNEFVYMDTSSICYKSYLYDLGTGIGYSAFSLLKRNITITKLDKTTGIISGTFEFDAYSEECGDTVHITQGRFDVKYKH